MVIDGIEYVTKSNFKLYCCKIYSNPDNPGMDDLERDLKNLSYVKRLISDYVDRGDIRDRLILNYIVTLSNLFGPKHISRILFFKVDEQYWSALKTFLKFLNLMPSSVTGLKKRVVDAEINTDVELYGRLLLL